MNTIKKPTHNNAAQLEYDSNPFSLSFKGFGLFVDHAKGVFIALLVLGLFGFISNIISLLPSPFSSESTDAGSSELASVSINPGVVLAIILLLIGLIALGILITAVFSATYKGFVAAGTLSAIEKKNITFGEAFSAMSERFTVLFVAEILISIRILGGLLLFIIPGIRAYLRYSPTPYILMKNPTLSASEGMEQSKKLYKNHLLEIFGIATVGMLIPIIGQSITASGLAMSVKQVSMYAKSNTPTPKTHILNYIGLIFIGIALLMTILAVSIISYFVLL